MTIRPIQPTQPRRAHLTRLGLPGPRLPQPPRPQPASYRARRATGPSSSQAMQRYRSSGRARGRTACSPGERLTAVLLASWWDLNPGAPGQRRHAQLRTRETMVNRGWHSSVPMEERMGQHAGARRHPAPRCRPRNLACAGMRDHGRCRLISWLVTAFVGLYLLAVWLIENDVTHRGAAASRLPAPAPGCAQDVRAERGVRLGQLPGAQRLDHRHPVAGPLSNGTFSCPSGQLLFLDAVSYSNTQVTDQFSTTIHATPDPISATVHIRI
jgi:hypothetical protein